MQRGEQVASADVELARGETKVATLSFTERSSGAGPASGEHRNGSAVPTPNAPVADNDVTSASTGGVSRRTWATRSPGWASPGSSCAECLATWRLQDKQEQIDNCPTSSGCVNRSGASSANDSAITKGAVSTVAFIAGALATTAGIVVIATDKTVGRETPGPKLS